MRQLLTDTLENMALSHGKSLKTVSITNITHGACIIKDITWMCVKKSSCLHLEMTSQETVSRCRRKRAQMCFLLDNGCDVYLLVNYYYLFLLDNACVYLLLLFITFLPDAKKK